MGLGISGAEPLDYHTENDIQTNRVNGCVHEQVDEQASLLVSVQQHKILMQKEHIV